MIKDLFEKSVLIFGCGNILWGDDGFGPAVIERLKEHYRLPANVLAMDVGTSIRDILFDLVLSDKKPRKIFIIDAVEYPDRKPRRGLRNSRWKGYRTKKPPTSRSTNFPRSTCSRNLRSTAGSTSRSSWRRLKPSRMKCSRVCHRPWTSAIDTACLRLMAALPGEGPG